MDRDRMLREYEDKELRGIRLERKRQRRRVKIFLNLRNLIFNFGVTRTNRK